MTTLSPETIKVIKSTVPVLEQHGEAITKHFYETMFAKHPELLNIFNHAHQKQGRQPKALANSIYAAAKHIENLEVILPVVKQIAHKHRSLGVKREHYPIVGENLLIAIKEVLGDAATDEIIDAWAKAYGVIANVFISVEEDMYEEVEKTTGGWKEWRTFVIERIEKESKVITSFYLKPADGNEIVTHQPGQYISVKCKIDGEQYTHIRQYSLSNEPGAPYYRISVKREEGTETKPKGVVSSFLHENVKVGDQLEVTVPAGDFILNGEKPDSFLFISGGVGLTPFVSMLHEVKKKYPLKRVTYIHAAIDGEHHAFDNEIKSLLTENDQYYVGYEKPTDKDKEQKLYEKEGYITGEWLQSIIQQHKGDIYFCGPIPFMKAIYKDLVDCNVELDRIHYEFFGPAATL